jgi:hypothetical protein
MKKYILQVLFGLILIIGLALLSQIFSGCKMSEQAAVRKIHRISENNLTALAINCEKEFPNIIVREKHDTTIIKGDSQTVYEIVPCPDKLLPNVVHDTLHHTQTIKVPIRVPGQTIYIFRDSITRIDSPKLKILNYRISALTDSLTIEKKEKLDEIASKKEWRKYCLIFGLMLLLEIIFIILKIGGKLSIPIKLPLP